MFYERRSNKKSWHNQHSRQVQVQSHGPKQASPPCTAMLLKSFTGESLIETMLLEKITSIRRREKSRPECVLSLNRQIADQTEDYICMYVWYKNKWMCQRMMDDQGNVLHPCSLIQPAEPPQSIWACLTTSSVREKPFSVQRCMVLKVTPFLIANQDVVLSVQILIHKTPLMQ